MINISHLTMRFGAVNAVDDVSISVRPGESVALCGANGAGKTTIIRCVAGLYRYAGQISVNGLDATRDGKRARQLIGYVPQDLGFNDDLRVGSAVEFFARLRGVRIDSVSETLRRVQLDGHDRKRMRELSGGMKQRLALAIALIGDPSVLLLDEVTASLDAVGRGDFIAMLASLARADGRCMLFASHRQEEIEALANRVVRLEQGKVVSDTQMVSNAVHAAPASVLHLTIEKQSCQRAIELLRETGFAAKLNGCGIFVQVDKGRRLQPIQLLADQQIPVLDFDVMPDDFGRSEP